MHILGHIGIVGAMEHRRLITSALPYVNNIPHLGNLIQVLSADVFARFCRAKGYDTLYVCGTDEYGTATETKALQEQTTPKELCDRYFEIHRDIYEWFEISFDHFGRTSRPEQTEIVQHIFTKVDENGYISEAEIEQPHCDTCDRFLADRFVHGTCPHCGYPDARGDQCESCGKLLDPIELKNSRCGVCGNSPEIQKTRHLYLNLPAILPKLEAWMNEASVEGFWARNALQMTKSWIRDGLKERCITRDLKWGIPVPKPGYEGKVFYVWFDAPIGYISITKDYTDDWERWWRSPDEVKLFQFIGKDNIPFHTVIFPASLLATGETWTLLHHMSSTEYLNYEAGKFSKSKGIGVFGTDVRDTGIPADVWRFYIFYNRPEKADYTFTWDDFQDKINGELIGNIANLVNRTLTFINRFYDAEIPEAEISREVLDQIASSEVRITNHLDRAELRDGLREICELSNYGNRLFQSGEPWKLRKSDPDQAASLLAALALIVKDLGILLEPFMPQASRTLLGFFDQKDVSWDKLGSTEGLHRIQHVNILFEKLESEQIASLRDRFSGTQGDRSMTETEKNFAGKVDLRVAKITGVTRHPKADKLYLEEVSLGDETRQIVSGLVPYYSEAELLGRNIILVYNLKPAKLRGEKSEGMLLAASSPDQSVVDVLFVDDVPPGTRLSLEGITPPEDTPGRITVDEFFAVPMTVKDSRVTVDSKRLIADGKPVIARKVSEGTVG